MGVVVVYLIVLFIAVSFARWAVPSHCKCPHCDYKIRPYEIHKCKSGRRLTCK